MPNETFRCVGCDKELEKRHMRISIKLPVDQKIDCISILNDEIDCIKSGEYDDPGFDGEKVLMLSRNAYRILRGNPMGYPVYFDPYTLSILYDAIEAMKVSFADDDTGNLERIMGILSHSMTQMEKPLCGSCAGEGICVICNEKPTE